MSDDDPNWAGAVDKDDPRLKGHYGSPFYDTPRPQVAPDGKWVFVSSDWDRTKPSIRYGFVRLVFTTQDDDGTYHSEVTPSTLIIDAECPVCGAPLELETV